MADEAELCRAWVKGAEAACVRELGHGGNHRTKPFCCAVTATGAVCARKLGHKGKHQSEAVLTVRRGRSLEYMRSTGYGNAYNRERYGFWLGIVDFWKTSHGCQLCGFQSCRPGYFDLDHIDRSDKEVEVSVLISTLTPNKPEHVTRFVTEVRKCQVLCTACHREKTRIDLSGPRTSGPRTPEAADTARDDGLTT